MEEILLVNYLVNIRLFSLKKALATTDDDDDDGILLKKKVKTEAEKVSIS